MKHSFGITIAMLTVAPSLYSAGCTDIGRPMDEKTLVSVIVDLHLLEARREQIADAHPALRDSVLAAHGVSHEDLREAILYYTDRPDEYVSLYNRVIDSLSAEQAEMEEAGLIPLLPPP